MAQNDSKRGNPRQKPGKTTRAEHHDESRTPCYAPNRKGGQEMNEKQIKMQELKAMVRAWTKEKSLTTAYDICEFLANNLDLEEGE